MQVWQDQEWRNRVPWDGEPSHFDIPAGSILLFDYRLLHRGQAHTGTSKKSMPVASVPRRGAVETNYCRTGVSLPTFHSHITWVSLYYVGKSLRPLLYYTYGRRWFSDTLNFPPVLAPYDTCP